MIVIRLKCNRCGALSEEEKNHRDAPMMLRHRMKQGGWLITDGRNAVDYCPKCKAELAAKAAAVSNVH